MAAFWFTQTKVRDLYTLLPLAVFGKYWVMLKPNEEKIAQVVLWELAAMRASLVGMKAQIDVMQEKLMGFPPSAEFLQESIDEEKATQLELFNDSCHVAGISPTPPSSPLNN